MTALLNRREAACIRAALRHYQNQIIPLRGPGSVSTPDEVIVDLATEDEHGPVEPLSVQEIDALIGRINGD